MSYRVLCETIFILLLTLTAQFLWKNLSILLALVPTVYFFLECHFRRRTWADVGFKIRTIPQDIANNWALILLVSVIIQLSVFLAARAWIPAYLDHVMARFPLAIGQTAQYLPGLFVGTLWEEINFRALYQERLSWFISPPVAIGFVSVVFGIGHWARGDPIIVLMDVLLVIIDGILYGIIFARSKNLFVAWIAHFLADIFGLLFILLL